MAEIDLFSPRKATKTNQRHLPKDHDPTKRTTYVQITLEEDEIAEAIRNYIRAQIPVRDGEELPVVLTAGRGENGHSASITLHADPVYVQSVERPTSPMATFDETAAAAARRNSDDEGQEDASDEEAESSAPARTAAHPNPAHPNPNRLSDTLAEAEQDADETSSDEDAGETEEAAAELKKQEEATQKEAPAAPVKKSNLFGQLVNDTLPEAPAPAAEETQQKAAPPKTKPKSIFDSLG